MPDRRRFWANFLHRVCGRTLPKIASHLASGTVPLERNIPIFGLLHRGNRFRLLGLPKLLLRPVLFRPILFRPQREKPEAGEPPPAPAPLAPVSAAAQVPRAHQVEYLLALHRPLQLLAGGG